MNTTRLVAFGVIVLFCGSIRAEDKVDTAKLMLGKWTVSKADEGTVPTGATVEFSKDGKIKFSFKAGDMEQTFTGTYKLEKNTFTMTMQTGSEEHKQTITIKKITEKEMITADKDGKSVELTRAK